MATTQTAPKKKGLINFDFLQKLGKVLMTVIAVMPAAGLMISLGKLVQMSGGDIAAVMTIGTTMENIGWAVINNLHILFAVAIGGSWAKERAGGAFAAVLAFALINVITGNIEHFYDFEQLPPVGGGVHGNKYVGQAVYGFHVAACRYPYHFCE